LYFFSFGDSSHACSDWMEAQRLGYSMADEVLAKFCK
jgi:hypothetical protein